VALGFATLNDYVEDSAREDATFFGATVGRYANRIAGGRFALDGAECELPRNNGPNTLHGGPGSYSAQVWEGDVLDTAALQLTYTDPDGYNGFPGTVKNTVTYRLSDENALAIEYLATTDAPTVLNLTNHTYFNLSGEGSGDVFGHNVQLAAERFTPVDAGSIPTGEFATVADTPFDFRDGKPLGRDIRAPDEQLLRAHGYDHNFLIDGTGLRLAASVHDPASGRVLRVHTTEPGLQLYSANFLVGDRAGTSGRVYRQGDGLALETQHYPDTPHHLGEAGWPSVMLRPGETFSSTTVLEFGLSDVA
jgi:aldose 1-epimerase